MTLGEPRANLPNPVSVRFKVRFAHKPGADGFVDALLSHDKKISRHLAQFMVSLSDHLSRWKSEQ